jgi:cytochrome c oxidase subunit 3
MKNTLTSEMNSRRNIKMSALSVSSRPNSIARTTLLVVLAAESTLFGTLLMAYLYLRVSPANKTFVPASSLDVLIAGLNSGVLLLSAWIARRATLAVRRNDLAGLKTNLVTALALGLVFVVGQVFEFQRSGMTPNDLAFGGVFFTLIGFHALHVLAGVVVLSINAVRAHLGDFSARRYTAVEVGTWFWYYVTGVWLVLFTALYLV